MRLFGARERSGAWLLGLALLVYCVPAYTVHYTVCRQSASRQYILNDRVMKGTAPAPYQYQMWLIAPVLKAASDQVIRVTYTVTEKVVPADEAISLVYFLFYHLGTVLFFIAFFRLCASVASENAAAITCLVLAAVYPVFWYDNFYHPSDPYGCLLAVWIVGGLLKRGPDAMYYILLFLSGFLWEKHVFIPVSVALAALLDKKPIVPTLLAAVAGTAVAAVGSLLPRYLIYPGPREWAGAKAIENLQGLHQYLIWVGILYGIALWRILRRPGSVPTLFRGMAIQFLIWPPLYFVLGGVLKEMRGIIIMIPLLWPVLAMSIRDQLGRAARPAAV
jgi:hypothetical protein